MGFFDWCSSAWDSVCDTVSSVADTVSSVASKAWEATKEVGSKIWEGAKNVAKKVVDTCINVGEKVVGTAKKVVKKVREVVNKVAPVVKTAARRVKNTIGVVYPWIGKAADIVVKGVEWLEKVVNSPTVDKIIKHLEWALDKSKKIRDTLFSKSEEQVAVQRQKELQEAMDKMNTEEQKRAIRFAMVINAYILVRTRIQNALDSFEINENANFDHYLRLRATQRLLQVMEVRLQAYKDITQVTSSDLFLIEISAELLAENPKLSQEDGIRLDKLVRKYFDGKGLLPFVFQELIGSWGIKLADMIEMWEGLNKEYATVKRELNALNIKKQIEDLSFDEEVEVTKLTDKEKDLRLALKYQENENRVMQNYVYAAEGFLQVLEKTEEQWVEEDRDWILEDSQEIGMLLIQCLENGVGWDDLTEEQQSLINDFANIFAEESKQRANNVKEYMAEEDREFNQKFVEVTA